MTWPGESNYNRSQRLPVAHRRHTIPPRPPGYYTAECLPLGAKGVFTAGSDSHTCDATCRYLLAAREEYAAWKDTQAQRLLYTIITGNSPEEARP